MLHNVGVLLSRGPQKNAAFLLASLETQPPIKGAPTPGTETPRGASGPAAPHIQQQSGPSSREALPQAVRGNASDRKLA